MKKWKLKVRKFKLDLSGKQQEEVDVDFDVQFDDATIGNKAPVTVNATPNVIPVDVQVIVEITVFNTSQLTAII